MKKVNHIALIEAGHATRFGPDWPGRRCGAKTRAGGACQNPAIGGRNCCKLHGGLSTGPRTAEGKARSIAAHTKHGRRSKAHVEKVKAINAELRRLYVNFGRWPSAATSWPRSVSVTCTTRAWALRKTIQRRRSGTGCTRQQDRSHCLGTYDQGNALPRAPAARSLRPRATTTLERATDG